LLAVDLLTISETNKLSKQILDLKEQNKDKEYIIRARLQEKESEMQIMKDQISSILSALSNIANQNQLNETAKILYNAKMLKTSST
jgi:hypothetical protein